MLETAVTIEEFDPARAGEFEWRALNGLRSQILAERFPDDPPQTVEQTIAGIRDAPAFVGKALWTVSAPDSAAIVAGAMATWLLTNENQHVVEVGIEVLPAWRQQGLAARLLARLVDRVEREGRRLLIGATYSTAPAGAEFMRRLDAHLALQGHTNQLDLATLDPALLAAWLARGQTRTAEFELGLWEGPYPEDQLDAVVELVKATNLAPRGDLDVQDFQWTAEQLRQQEGSMAARSIERWTMYVRDRATGELAGYTEVFWRPGKPAVLDQGFTAVWPKYRNRSLGRWLKAAMLDKVLRDRPQVRFVRTGNADSNAAMLKINHELGFRPYSSESVWQIDTARVRAYLAGRA